MSPSEAINVGIHMIDDFVCSAIPGPGVAVPEDPAIGVNAGIDVRGEHAHASSPIGIAIDRVRELTQLSNAQLLELIQKRGAQLPVIELWFVHDIALDRLAKQQNLGSDDAVELSRATMRLALRKIA